MSNKKTRKISFNTIIKREWKTNIEQPFDEIVKVIKHTLSLSKKDKQFEMKDDKFCLLQSAKIETDSQGFTVVTGLFKSARHTFRPNLIDKATGEERTSPKRLTEGDVEKTHFAIKVGNDEVFLVVEINGNGVSVNQIVEYFQRYSKIYFKEIKQKTGFSLIWVKMAKQNFLQQIKSMKRIKIAKVFFDKSLLGNKCLKFSDKTSNLQRNLELTVKAERETDITETAIDFWNFFSNNINNSVSKVRIEGRDNNGTDVVLDTSFMEKIDSIDVNLNGSTGEVQTIEMTTALKAFINDLN